MTAPSSSPSQSLLSRRAMLQGAAGIAYASLVKPAVASRADATFSLPIGMPGRTPGDGFFIRHGYACENTWYNPGWLHAGEDWYALEGDTAGATVYAVASGDVVFAGVEYPGRVVIVRHASDLYSMYGHLDEALRVKPGDSVRPGQPLGTVLYRTDGRAPSHVHFEMRAFLTKREVNGASPRYGYGCGVNCPPGPVNPGDTYPLLTVATGREASLATSAEGYRLWYRIEAPSIGRVWVRAAWPSPDETGSDGRPSSVMITFLPVIASER